MRGLRAVIWKKWPVPVSMKHRWLTAVVPLALVACSNTPNETQWKTFKLVTFSVGFMAVSSSNCHADATYKLISGALSAKTKQFILTEAQKETLLNTLADGVVAGKAPPEAFDQKNCAAMLKGAADTYGLIQAL